MIELLLSTHFPGCNTTQTESLIGEGRIEHPPSSRTKGLATRIFTPSKVDWAIRTFKPFKAPGGDGIFPALLQKGLEDLLPTLCELYRASFSFAYISKLWREVNVAFIPKGGGRSSAHPKSYRPISLSSFVLKGMEKAIDQYLRDEVLNKSSLYTDQHAYRKARSTITALHKLVRKIEDAIESKQLALCAFIDIEGAFDNTSWKSIEWAAKRKGFHPEIVAWLKSMLSCRRVKVSVAGESVVVGTDRGCPQGGILSPLLWSIVIDDLLTILTDNGFMVQGYADDLVIMIREKMDAIASQRMQRALDTIQTWCQGQGLRINPQKTIIVPFTKRRKLLLRAPTLDGTVINFSSEVKYLGITLDQKLNWNSHLDKLRRKALVATLTYRRLLGRNWGINPRITF